MEKQEITLNKELAGGWIVRSVEVRLPFALLTIERRGQQRLMRVDLDKQIFLDEPPTELPRTEARIAAKAILDKMERV